jgi:hypothetical protein
MELDYEAWLRRDEELARPQEARLKRELLGEFMDVETGCTPEEMEVSPMDAVTNRNEAA